MEQSKSEVCSIRILFPVESDEQAIEYKKKIDTILSEVKDVQINFGLTTMPSKPPMG
ncbi:hypothetical protein LCGC14_1429140 [marine sediment metagenome]|uniref:Thiamine-binding protein domain-containing protein n=1 Tax=marine sediment metagenome TaxID=412755 RepID=A0A0F9JPE1_9ZZZZ